MTKVVLAFGSNLGDRAGYIFEAIARLREVIADLRSSSLYQSRPMYVTDQPAFLNGVLVGECDLGPLTLLAQLTAAEHAIGRQKRFQNGPREIDLDLVSYGSLVLASPGLILPHPRLAERKFVLEPLQEIAPDIILPSYGRLDEMLKDVRVEGQRLEKVENAPI